MFKLIIGRAFELAIENGGLYIRVGRRDLWLSR